MAEFLSPEWVAALDRAVRGSDRLAACARGRTLVLEQRVELPDRTEHAHHLVVGVSGARAVDGDAEAPDVVVFTDLATARALALGEVNAQHALATGRLRIRGDASSLVARSDELAALDDVFASLRAVTTFPEITHTPVTSVE